MAPATADDGASLRIKAQARVVLPHRLPPAPSITMFGARNIAVEVERSPIAIHILLILGVARKDEKRPP